MWVVLALLCAWFLATSDMLCKRALEKGDPFIVAWARLAFSCPFIIACGVYSGFGTPPADLKQFSMFTVLLVPLEIAALYLYMRALQISPLSLCAPFLAFTPGFILVTGWLILGEFVGAWGAVGVALVIAGAYVLSSSQNDSGPLAPIRNFLSEPGCVMMAVVAFIYSITAAGGKKLILLSSPMYTAYVYFLAILAGLTVVAAMRPGGPEKMAAVLKKPIMWGIGLTQAGMIITHTVAISMAPAAYMISVKRTSLLFGVAYGLLIFKEKDAAFRAPGGAVMLLGVFVIGFLSV